MAACPTVIALAILCLGVTTPAANVALADDGPTRELSNPWWRGSPTPREIENAWAAAAPGRGPLNEVVTATCRLTNDGRLDSCSVARGSPSATDQQVASAIHSLEPFFVTEPQDSYRNSVGGARVSISIPFYGVSEIHAHLKRLNSTEVSDVGCEVSTINRFNYDNEKVRMIDTPQSMTDETPEDQDSRNVSHHDYAVRQDLEMLAFYEGRLSVENPSVDWHMIALTIPRDPTIDNDVTYASCGARESKLRHTPSFPIQRPPPFIMPRITHP